VSAERIDHVAKAAEWLTPAEGTGLSWEETAGLTAIAQVHATLALAEQQRIANLIALFTISDEDAEDFVEHGVAYTQVLLEIKKGLAL
jgi:hypothetical protein